MTHEVPYLRAGAGRTPADGGCILQMADWRDCCGWSDKPKCVHLVIRPVAIKANDWLGDEERQKLLPLTSRIMGTNVGDEALTRRLLGYLARQVYPLWEAWTAESGYDDGGAVLACIDAAECGEAAEDAGGAAGAAEVAAGAAGAARAAGAAGAAGAARAAEVGGAAIAATAAGAEGAPDPYELLVGLLDRFDELTGRGTPGPVNFESVCAVLSAEHKRVIDRVSA